MSRQCLEYPKCSSVLSQGSSLNDYCLTMLIKLLPVFEKNVKSYSWLCPTAEIPALVNLEWDGVISFHLLSFIFDVIYSGNKNIVNMACDPMTLILMLPFPCKQYREEHIISLWFAPKLNIKHNKLWFNRLGGYIREEMCLLQTQDEIFWEGRSYSLSQKELMRKGESCRGGWDAGWIKRKSSHLEVWLVKSGWAFGPVDHFHLPRRLC